MCLCFVDEDTKKELWNDDEKKNSSLTSPTPTKYYSLVHFFDIEILCETLKNYALAVNPIIMLSKR